jgi:flagellar protein FliO/FliZ
MSSARSNAFKRSVEEGNNVMNRSFHNPVSRWPLILLVLQPLRVLADTSAQTPVLRPPPGAPDVLSVATSLVLVIGAIFLVGWLYSRTQRIRGGVAGEIRVVAVQPLGAKERIVIVQIAGKQLVVGVTSSNISTLHTFDEQVVDPAQTMIGGSFAARLRTALKSRRI